MAIQLLILVVGLALIVFGADWLVDGASGIARKAGISEFVIGLTIVGFGTSCPELVVSLTGAIAGKSDISAGNVIGSNIFNTLLILGLTAVITPIAITRENRRRDIPMTIAVTLLFILCGMSFSLFKLGSFDGISRIEGTVFLALFVFYIYRCFKTGSAPGEAEAQGKQLRLAAAFGLVVAGLAGLIVGGKLFVNSASEIARMAGMSDKFIAVVPAAFPCRSSPPAWWPPPRRKASWHSATSLDRTYSTFSWSSDAPQSYIRCISGT